MTISRLSAGNGYAYYTSVTVSADQHRGSRELGDYYLETGTPEGQWMGRGAADLGIDGPVTEAQMRALFGDGLHPNADQMIADLIARGHSPKKAIAAARLGRPFAVYEAKDNDLARGIEHAAAQLATELGRELTADERAAVRMRQAGILFKDRHGRSGSRQEVAKLLASELSAGHQSVAGFDLTFSAPKSVSVAWAVADETQSQLLEAAHERAITATIAWLEDEVIRTRTGAGGVAFHATAGLLATRFRHWESREGDPQLHDHVVISNKVKLVDAGREKWLTIDSRSLFKATMNASSVYNRALADELKGLGVELRRHTTRSGKHTGMELAAVSDQQLDLFSSRSRAIEQKTAELVADYVAQHGRQPATKEMLTLRQQATLQTRTPKSQAVTRSQLRDTWRQQLGDATATLTAKLTEQMRRTPTVGLEPAVNVAAVAAQIIDDVSSKQSVWNRNHVETRLNMWAAQQTFAVPKAVFDQVLDEALNVAGICITPTVDVPAHPETINPDGTSVYRPPAADLYTSAAVLEAEDRLVDAARDVALPAVSETDFEAALRVHDGPLDQGQIDLAHQVACDEHLVTVGIGPAGTGKTTAMQLALAAARQTDGVTVHGVTVSASAADQLSTATGMQATTIAKWLHDLNHGQRTINPGDIIVVDEAGMASARDLGRIVEHATASGAFVRLIGDDRQLQAIGAGGTLRMIAADVGAVRLDQVWRFRDDAEAAASLRLRNDGDVDWYLTQQRVHGGTHAATVTRIVDAWLADLDRGQSSVMMASTNSDVTLLNQLAQDQLIQRGRVTLTRTVELADGCTAGVGDVVVTRRNDRRMTVGTGHGFVKNGDLWTITGIDDRGDLSVVDEAGRATTLPREYVGDAVQLGYAATVHRVQGRTVDTAHLLLDEHQTREALYVGVTRGRDANHVYAVTDGRTAADQMRAVAARTGHAMSARELIGQAQAEAGHPGQLVRILRDMQTRADHHRYTSHIRTLLPEIATRVLTSDKQPRLFAALARAEDRGFTPERILDLANRDLPGDVGDPTGLLVWRINQHLQRCADLMHDGHPRPMRDVPDSDLQRMLADATVRAATTSTAAYIEAIGAHLPQILGGPGQARVVAALARADQNGLPPGPVLAVATTGLPRDVDDPSRLISARIFQQIDAHLAATTSADGQEPAVQGPVPPDPHIERLYELTAAAADFYRQQYPGSPAAAYVTDRFGEDLTNRDMTIGYAPHGWTTLVDHLRHHHAATDAELVDAGLASRSSRGSLIDVFRDRIVLGLHNDQGRLVGFTGRCNPAADANTPKYINTPATAIFDKSHTVFGLAEHRTLLAAGAIPVRTEGAFDAIAITLAGDGHAVGVAPMGTALTDQQAAHIANATPQGIVLSALDHDKAGQKAATKDYRAWTRLGIEPRELVLINNVDDQPIKDPADAWRIDPTTLRLALAMPDIAPSMAAQVIRGRLNSDPHLIEHAAARVEAARDLGRIISTLNHTSWPAEISSAAAALAAHVNDPDSHADYTPIIYEAAIRAATGWTQGTPPPDVDGLRILLDDLQTHAPTAREVLDQLRHHTAPAVPDWATRRHGRLTDTQLRDHTRHTRQRLHLLDRAIDELHQQLRPAHMVDVPATIAARQRARLTDRLERLNADRRVLLHDDATLRREASHRAHLPHHLQAEEDTQRAADYTPAPDGTPTSERAAAAAELRRNLWLETRYREHQPDTTINQRPHGALAWAIPGRGTTDPATPASWRQPLTAMNQQVADSIRSHGAALALNPPTWATRYLGPVPSIDTPLRSRWEHLAGHIDTWRNLTQHTDPVKALPTPRLSTDASHQADRDLHVLHAAASDLRRDNPTLEPPAPAPGTPTRIPALADISPAHATAPATVHAPTTVPALAAPQQPAPAPVKTTPAQLAPTPVQPLTTSLNLPAPGTLRHEPLQPITTPPKPTPPAPTRSELEAALAQAHLDRTNITGAYAVLHYGRPNPGENLLDRHHRTELARQRMEQAQEHVRQLTEQLAALDQPATPTPDTAAPPTQPASAPSLPDTPTAEPNEHLPADTIWPGETLADAINRVVEQERAKQQADQPPSPPVAKPEATIRPGETLTDAINRVASESARQAQTARSERQPERTHEPEL